MNFGKAIEALKDNKKVARAGWNGKKMFLVLVDGDEYSVDDPDVEMNYEHLPWIGLKTANDEFVPWLASQTDILAEDWSIVE